MREVEMREFFYTENNPNQGQYIDDSERKKRRPIVYYAIFMIIYERKWRIPADTIYLSSEKRSEISKQSSPEKCLHDSIEVFTTIFFMILSEDKKYEKKSKHCTK